MRKYIPLEFEKKWEKYWEENGVYQVHKVIKFIKPENKKYIFPMFPYPSGAGLHVGHVRVYTATDVIARFFRMNGDTVLHPMGWDAFGLPAENAAVKAKKNPMDMVPNNIATFKNQMKSLGFSYDWNREFATTDPEYYKWTQWLFIQFYKAGLLYKKNTPINFCPVCKTGLAEEEVLPNGTHERCGNKIEKKDLPQWVFKITDYADRLLKDLDGLDWPKGILEMQRNWIGRKEGINITYKVIGSSAQFLSHESLPAKTRDLESEKIAHDLPTSNYIDEITCFTTRPDTNFGATFIVLAPEHEFVNKILNSKSQVLNKFQIPNSKFEEIRTYVEKAKAKTQIEREAEGRKKTGVFTGFYAVNNLNGYKMPVWISDFVLMGFGTGAVVGVPGHDVRDFEFAQEYELKIIRVVVGKDGDKSPITKKEQVQEEEGIMINSDFLNELDIHVATQKIMDYLEEKRWGKRVVTYHLRDWIFSRQRYWGEPIPMVYCEGCAKNKISYVDTDDGKTFRENSELNSRIHNSKSILNSKFSNLNSNYGWFPLPDDQLPLKLPYVKSYEPSDTGESPLSKIPEFVNTKCPHCGGPAKRETDTMPNWAGSCWYFIAFSFWNQEKANLKFKIKNLNLIENWKLKIENFGHWLPTDWYIGGAEHAVLHLLYARFWVKALYDLKLINFKEPFLRLRNVGMIIAEDSKKMSKSFGNVINPDEVIKEFGADALRIYEMFMAPFSQEIAWSTSSLQGSYRFITRVWKLYNLEFRIQNLELKENKQLVSKLYKTIQKVTEDIPDVKFNTAIAAMMEFINAWEASTTAAVVHGLSVQHAKQFLQILAPFAPFAAEEIWHEIFKEKESIHLSSWPKVDEKAVVDDAEVEIPVQVNGKVRTVIQIQSSKCKVQSYMEETALKEPQVKKYLEGKKYKVVYVAGKILNFVTDN